MTTKLYFHLAISAEQALRYYQGTAQSIVTRASNGQSIRFPASHIRSFITQDGIHGDFSIEFDDTNKLISIERIR